MTMTIEIDNVTDPALAAEIVGPIYGVRQSAPAGTLAPGDYLPPQPCLATTIWKTTGFRVGRTPQAVRKDAPGHQGKVLLLGPLGVLDGLPPEAIVHVIRRSTSPTDLPTT